MKNLRLFIGAHPDDLEIGATGLLIQSLNRNIECDVLVFSDTEEQHGNEGISKEFIESMKILGIENYSLLDLPNTELPANCSKIREALENLKKEKKPELVITHSLGSIHQDHFIVAKECERVFRYISVISYEDLKSTPYFAPKLYIPLSKEVMIKKLDAADTYKTQQRRYWYNKENIRALARTRGIESGVKYAEAYEIIRLIKKLH